jgi:lysophospholipase L1-like esterase
MMPLGVHHPMSDELETLLRDHGGLEGLARELDKYDRKGVGTLHRFAMAGCVTVVALSAFVGGDLFHRWRHPPHAFIEFDHWADRTQAILSQANQEHFETAILGDSITEFAYLPPLCGQEVLNAGVGGFRLAQGANLLTRLLPLFGGTKNIVLIIGLNDALWTQPRNLDDFTASYDAMVAHAETSGGRIWLGTVGPVAKSMPHGEAYFDAAYIGKINERISREASQWHVDMIDFNHALSEPDGSLATDDTIDGVHLKASGYAKWRGALTAAVACP